MSKQSELVPGTKIEFYLFQVPVETRLPSGNFRNLLWLMDEDDENY